MDEFTTRKVRRLRTLLAGLPTASADHIKVVQFRAHLTPDEWQEYQERLAANRIDPGPPSLSPAAQDYWDAFRALCLGVNLARSAEQRNRLVDEAAELMDQFAALPPSDQGRFRTLDLSQGDTTWANALHELEHNLPFLNEDATRSSHLDHPENHTQREFLTNLIERLDPPEQERSTPQEDALRQQRVSWLRGQIKRLSR